MCEETGCWEWSGAKGGGKLLYGQSSLDGKGQLAHRVSYQLFVGPIPDGLDLDHTCRNTLCVNPAHLEPKTHRQNVLVGNTVAARNAAVTHCPRGHAYDERNTRIQPKGGRACKECGRLAVARWRQNNPLKAKEIAREASRRRAKRQAEAAAQEAAQRLRELGFAPRPNEE